jgi:hypothetical protein
MRRIHVDPNDLAAIVCVSLLLSGLAIYLANRPASPPLRISEVSFRLGREYRTVEVHVKASGSAEVIGITVNGEAVPGLQTDRRMILEGEEATLTFKYPWRMGKSYTIRVEASEGASAELTATAPAAGPSLILDVENVSIRSKQGSTVVGVDYRAEAEGASSLQVILFTYLSFTRIERPIYVLHDRAYMPEESLERAEEIVRQLQAYNLTAIKLDYEATKTLSEKRPEAILVVVNPLADGRGRRLDDAMPATLLDPDGDGYLAEHSRYGRSLLYDWMRDGGLVLVTVGSLEPYKRILYKNRSYTYARDSTSLLDAHLFLTDASGTRPILGGSMVIGDYSPTRITGTLGLSYRESSMALDRDAMEGYGLSYYSYGEYRLSAASPPVNLTLPAFVRVGRGGWLPLGDDEAWLKPEELAHDLLMIALHSVWDSEWIPYGWHWDSGTAHYKTGGMLEASGRIETAPIPSHLLRGNIVVRVLGLAYSEDLGLGVKIEWKANYELAPG